MKKVILRIVVAAILLAIIVLVLMMTVFKTPSTLEAYNKLNESLCNNGQITTLSKSIKDNVDEFKTKYGEMVYIFDNELISLQENYSKLFYLKDVDNSKMKEVSSEISKLEENLKISNEKLININSLKQGNQENIDIDEYIENAKLDVAKSLNSLCSVNSAINDFLLENYFGGNYGEELFLNKIRTEIGKEYFKNFNEAQSAGIEDKEVLEKNALDAYEFYVHLIENKFSIDTATGLNELYVVMTSAKNVNVGRIVQDFKKYVEENKLTEETINDEIKIKKLLDIGAVMEFINSLDDEMGNKNFSIRDSESFVKPALAGLN